MRNQHIENTNADDLPKLDDQGQRNFAWASSNGDIDGRAKLPANTITIDQEVMVEEEHSGSVTPTSRRHNELSDAGSEEWIFDGDGRKI